MCTLNLHAYPRLSYSHVCLKLCNLMTKNLISTKTKHCTFLQNCTCACVWLMYIQGEIYIICSIYYSLLLTLCPGLYREWDISGRRVGQNRRTRLSLFWQTVAQLSGHCSQQSEESHTTTQQCCKWDHCLIKIFIPAVLQSSTIKFDIRMYMYM